MKLLLLLWFISMTKGDYRCTIQGTLIDYNGIKIRKTDKNYQVSLCLSSGDYLLRDRNFINCNQICEDCQTILSNAECPMTKRKCEQRLDASLIEYYTNATFSYCTNCSLSTQAEVTSSKTTTKNVTTSPEPTVDTTTITDHCTCNQGAEANTQISTTIFGVFTGLLVVALSIVSTGWLWTCWVFRRRIDNSKQNCSSSEDERSYTNPTYGETTESLPTTVTATYDVVDPNSQSTTAVVDDGQMYNVLNRSQPEGHNDVSNTANVCTNGDYSHLDLDLQKPTKDDYEDPDNGYGLTEYEVPQTLNKT